MFWRPCCCPKRLLLPIWREYATRERHYRLGHMSGVVHTSVTTSHGCPSLCEPSWVHIKLKLVAFCVGQASSGSVALRKILYMLAHEKTFRDSRNVSRVWRFLLQFFFSKIIVLSSNLWSTSKTSSHFLGARPLVHAAPCAHFWVKGWND